MSTNPSDPKPKALSLVFAFLDQLRLAEDAWGPEPDFRKWTETHLYPDTATASDNAMDDELSVGERHAWQAFQKWGVHLSAATPTSCSFATGEVFSD
jgi:hypothetical protein